MNKTLAVSLTLLSSATAFAATPLENAAALAARLGVSVSPRVLPNVATPPASDAPFKSGAAAPVAAVPISGYITATGRGFLNCSGGPYPGSMSGWITLRADVEVRTRDGASGIFPVTGNVFLSGSCQNGGGFVSGNAMINGWGTVYKLGRPVGTAALSGNAFVNQYVSGGFASISQTVFVSGQYNSNGLAGMPLLLREANAK